MVVVNRDTGLRREAMTNTDGAYTLTNVQNGPYDVRVAMTGFREAVRANVPVAVGQISRVDVSLEVGGFEQIVEVSAPVQLLQTDKADMRTELKADGNHEPAAQPVPELPDADQPGARIPARQHAELARRCCRSARSTSA